MSKQKAIMLYDFLLVKGGAEAVTIDLCNSIERLDLGLAFIDRKLFEQDPIDTKRIRTLCDFTPIVGWQILKASLFFRHRAKWLAAYDRVMFSGICSLMGVDKCSNDANKIYYCHTPPRFIYDLKDFYLDDSSAFKRFLIKVLIAYMKPRYEKAIAKMDVVIANSHNVRQRLKTYLDVDAEVIYPPCHIDKYEWIEQGDFYLSTARVEGYKRIEKIVQAFITMPDKKLVVASGGSELARLKEIARDAQNIAFTGWCSAQQLKQLMGTCIATLYLPMHEDFGMSPVESMAAGKPVVGVKEGGVMETVIDGKTGVLCPADPQVKDIIAAVEMLHPERALSMRQDCIDQAQGFSAQAFCDKMQQLFDCPAESLQSLAKQLSPPEPKLSI